MKDICFHSYLLSLSLSSQPNQPTKNKTTHISADIWQCSNVCRNGGDTNQMQWRKRKKLKLKIPLSRFAWIWLQRIQVIVIFGGWTNGPNPSNKIFILDLNGDKCNELKRIKCPGDGGRMHAVLSLHSNGKEMIHLFKNKKHFAIDLLSVLPPQYHSAYLSSQSSSSTNNNSNSNSASQQQLRNGTEEEEEEAKEEVSAGQPQQQQPRPANNNNLNSQQQQQQPPASLLTFAVCFLMSLRI